MPYKLHEFILSLSEGEAMELYKYLVDTDDILIVIGMLDALGSQPLSPLFERMGR